MSRDVAARYVGVGTTKFDEMVADGRMPRPKKVDSRLIWDRWAIDVAFSGLPSAGNRIDEILANSNGAPLGPRLFDDYATPEERRQRRVFDFDRGRENRR